MSYIYIKIHKISIAGLVSTKIINYHWILALSPRISFLDILKKSEEGERFC